MCKSIQDIAQKISCYENRRLEKIGVEKLRECLEELENRGFYHTGRTVLLKRILDKSLTKRPFEAFEDATKIELIDTIQILFDIAIAEITKPYINIIHYGNDEFIFEKTQDGTKITKLGV